MMDAFIHKAIAYGAAAAREIDAHSIVTAPWVRLKCQFGCEGFNSSFCCPPQTPTAEETGRVIACYQRALLVHVTTQGHPSNIVSRLEKDLLSEGFYKAIGFGAGPCSICETCPPDRCRHPAKARPAMEACGIDVFATVRANGFALDVLKTQRSKGNYYGLVLVD